jgi:PAS domain S-box-containing protein
MAFLMGEMGGLGLGIIFGAVGLFFFVAARFLMRTAPKTGPNPAVAEPPTTPLFIRRSEMVTPQESPDAVLVVQAGGRLHSLNRMAREAFQIEAVDSLDLERISRRIRPTHAFLSLCSTEGRAALTLDGRTIDGSSYRLPGDDPLMMVALRFADLASDLEERGGGLGAQTLRTFTELSTTMASSLDLSETVQAILDGVEKLVPADFSEMTVWDNEQKDLMVYRLIGLPGTERLLDEARHVSAGEGYSGVLYRDRKSLVIADIAKRGDIRPGEGRMPGLRSFLGVVLVVGKEFVGTLELGSRSVGAFDEQDQALLHLVSGQAAVALHNALVYLQERRKSAELSGLSQLAQTFSSVRDPKILFSRLVASTSPLFNFEILGYLIYNENQHVLEGRIPFHGLPDPFIELYRAEIAPNSQAEHILFDQDVLISEDASSDPQWDILGLSHLARAASLRDTVLTPLTSGGRTMGYLQASNHRGGARLSQSELNLLALVANQAGSIIENAFLVQEARQRAQRAEVLRQIVSLAGAADNLDKVLVFAVQEIVRLLDAGSGAIFLVDQARTVLQLHQPSLVGSLAVLPERSCRLLLEDPQYALTVSGSQRVLHMGNRETSSDLIAFYRSVTAAWKIESLIAIPLVVRSEGIGEIWFGSSRPSFFDAADVQLVSTAAGQLAGAVEQVFLRTQTDESLRRRMERLMSVSRISRELNNTLNLDRLLELILAETLNMTGAKCGSVVLFDMSFYKDAPVVVRSWHGDVHEPTLSAQEIRAVETAAAIRVDTYEDGDEHPSHAGVRSALIMPILYQNRVAGLIHLHGGEENQFSQADQDICQSLAVQASVALGNAVQYEDQRKRSALLARELDTIAELLQVSRMLRPSLPLEQSLTAIGGAIRQATPFQVNVISVVEVETMLLHRVCSIGLPNEQWGDLQKRVQSWNSIQQLLLPEFRNNSIYFIPADKSPALPPDVYTITVTTVQETSAGGDAWHPDDFLLVPLYDSNNFPVGLISLDAPSDGRRPDRPTFEALEIFGIQAALMIENHRRLSFMEKRVAEMEIEQGRLQQSTGSALQNLPMLLRKDLDQTVTLKSLNQRVERIRASLEMSVLAGAEETPERILRVLAQELVNRFALQVALIAEKDSAGIRLTDVIGTVPEQTNPNALFGQRNPLRQLLLDSGGKTSDALLVANLENSADWNGTPLLASLQTRSFIGLSLSGGQDNHYAVLAVGRRSLAAFSEDDRRTFVQLAQQVGMGLQSRRLLRATQLRLDDLNRLLDFSLKLSSLQPDEILAALVENALNAVDNAQSGWAGLWDAHRGLLSPQAVAGYPDGETLRQMAFRASQNDGADALPLQVLKTGLPLRRGQIDFNMDYNLGAEDLNIYRRATRDRLPDSALILPLRLGETANGVLVLENFDQPNAFSAGDEALAYSFSQQAALSLDNARLYQSTSQRASQMQSLARAASLLTSSLKSEELIAALLDWLALVIPYRTALLWLRDGDGVTVRDLRGFDGNAGLLGITVHQDEPGLFHDVIASGAPIVVPDVRKDARFPSLVEPKNLSWAGLPLSAHGEVIGLIALEGDETDFFSPDRVQAALTFTSQAAVALENARLFQESSSRAEELDQRSRRLALLNRLSGDLGRTLDATEILALTGRELSVALGGVGVAGVLLGPGATPILETEEPPRGPLPLALFEIPVLARLLQTQGLYATSDVEQETELVELVNVYCRSRKARALLIVPLLSGEMMHGWMMIDRPEVVRFLPAEMELARTICNQAATAIQTARLYDEIRSQAEFLEKRVDERTSELRSEHRNSQTLLRVISELSTSLDMNLVMHRALTVINESFGAQESLVYMLQDNDAKPFRAGEVLTINGAGTALQKDIMRVAARSRQSILITDLSRDERVAVTPENVPAYRSVLAIPLVMGEDVLGVLMMLHTHQDFFRPEQCDLAEATARQLGIAIRNAELFNLIRDQSENLGAMLREQQIESSRSRAILEAVADGVVVTDDQGCITLFNQSAERILGLDARETVGKNLDLFSGLFGRSGAAWMRTIRGWMVESLSEDERTFSDQFELDTGSVIAVSLAPVFFRTQFLGTVSIFRDITHEVQVDRLKSEFVANVSHELRTPMTSIKGYVEIMLMGASGDLNDKQRHFLSIVKTNTERLGVLVNDLLDISRIETGRVKLNMQAIDLRELVQDVVFDIRRRSHEENKAMRFVVDAPVDLPAVIGDIERVRQVLNGLISNGYNYTPAEGQVDIRMCVVGGEVQIDVQDNGIGIHPGDQHRIFERFYRGEDPLVLATAGTGLGLAISRTLVAMHNGRIWFTSTGVRGEGSTFSFTLPVFKVEE